MNIVIVAHYFEPFNQVGAVRMTSLCRYLTELGHGVTVIKADNRFYGKDVIWDEKSLCIKRLTVSIKKSDSSLFETAWRNAYKKAIEKAILKKPYDWILFSGGPYFYFSLGRYFKKKYDLNYILDFRDLWIHESIQPVRLLSKVRDDLIRILYSPSEYCAVKHARYVLTVTESDSARMKKAYHRFANKFYVISNGYDDKKLLGFSREESLPVEHDTINLMVFGKFIYYGTDFAKLFLAAVKELLSRGKQIKITHIGKEEEGITELLASFDLPQGSYRCTGICDYIIGMEILRHADLFISIYPVVSGLGTKIYDYIYLNKPIILYGYKSSEIADAFGKFENFYCCESTEESLFAINKMIEAGTRILDRNLDVAKYSRSAQWDKLCRLLLNS